MEDAERLTLHETSKDHPDYSLIQYADIKKVGSSKDYLQNIAFVCGYHQGSSNDHKNLLANEQKRNKQSTNM